MTTKTTKKTATTSSKDVVVLTIDGEKKEYLIKEPISGSFLETDFNNIKFIPVNIYREIARQLDIIDKVWYGPLNPIYEAINKKGKKTITFERSCFILLKDGREFEGVGYHCLTEGKLASDAVFGQMSMLKARAFKDALKFVETIFEFPDELEGAMDKDEDKASLDSEATRKQEQSETKYNFDGTQATKKEAEDIVKMFFNSKLSQDYTQSDVINLATEFKTKYKIEDNSDEYLLISDILLNDFIPNAKEG